MALARLVYTSENMLDKTRGSIVRELSAILSAANRNNKPRGITGALVFDDMWFLQLLEGDAKVVLERFARLQDDDRHTRVTLREFVEIDERIFANWWMGLAARTPQTEHLFQPYCRNGLLQVNDMRASEIVQLMKDLSQFGLRRELAAA